MLIKGILAFLCLAKAERDKNEGKIRSEPLADPNFYIDQLKAEKIEAKKGRRSPSKIPVILDNVHIDGDWEYHDNGTDDDPCSYVEQSDGSVLISTAHRYSNYDRCHEYWECDNQNHNMFFKWNRVEIEDDYPDECAFDWARFAWGTKDDQQEQGSTDPLVHGQDNLVLAPTGSGP